MMGAHGASGAILVGYGAAEQVHPSVQAATVALTAASVPVREVLRVDGGRYFGLTCYNPACCPPEGTPFDPTSSSAAAAATVAGMVALPDRAAVAARLAPVTGPPRDRMIEATTTAAQFVLDLIAAVAPDAGDDPDTSLDTPVGRALLAAGRTYLAQAQHRYRTGMPVDDEQAALVTVLLNLPSVRDFAALHTSGAPWQIDMWTDLDQAVWTAAAADIIEGLSEGLESRLETQGRNVSGGQRQRLRLVRALLVDAPVLLLVEPTLALDAQTEANIAERLRTTRQGRTTLVVSTSPLVLNQADQVCYLVDGKVVATGTHGELLATAPGYRRLVFRGADDEGVGR